MAVFLLQSLKKSFSYTIYMWIQSFEFKNIYVNNVYVVVSSQAQMTATVILLPGVLGECLAVLIVLWLLLQLSGQQILPQLATAQ